MCSIRRLSLRRKASPPNRSARQSCKPVAARATRLLDCPALIVARNAVEFRAECALRFRRVPLSARHAADVGAVHLQLPCDAAVETTQSLHVALTIGILAFGSVAFASFVVSITHL